MTSHVSTEQINIYKRWRKHRRRYRIASTPTSRLDHVRRDPRYRAHRSIRASGKRLHPHIGLLSASQRGNFRVPSGNSSAKSP
jgi:hypothetical protein